MSAQDNYDIYFKKFYTELFKFQNGKKSSLKCAGCEGKKRFIINDDKLTFSCGPNNSDNLKCGPQYTIELPKYIHFRDLQKIYDEQINGSFNYEKDNLLEYDLTELSKKMDSKTDLQKQQIIVKESTMKLKKLIDDYIKINKLEDYSDRLKILSDKRYKNGIDKQKIMRMIMEDELSEPEKKDLRIKYAQLIRENTEFIDMIIELRKPNTDYIMIQKPKVIDHIKSKKDGKKKVEKKEDDKEEDKKGDKKEVDDKEEDDKEKIKKYSFADQLKILTEFYKKVDPKKTEDDMKRIINNRRPKGKPIGTRIPSGPWIELCEKLSKKYDHDILSVKEDSIH